MFEAGELVGIQAWVVQLELLALEEQLSATERYKFPSSVLAEELGASVCGPSLSIL